jgi:hypothetical protein
MTTITEQAFDLTGADADESVVSAASDPGAALEVAKKAMKTPGLPVPADKTAVAMFTAHRLDQILHLLAHATERMQAARAATAPQLRAYHAVHIRRHLAGALVSAHWLTSNIRDHYPAEAAELEQVKQNVGLAQSLTPEIKSATAAHLLETTLHEMTHGVRHAQQMEQPEPADVWEFNADHAEKHLTGAREHAGKLTAHFRDNYPDVAELLTTLDQLVSGTEDGDAGPQHARYSKGGASMAQDDDSQTISGQLSA